MEMDVFSILWLSVAHFISISQSYNFNDLRSIVAPKIDVLNSIEKEVDDHLSRGSSDSGNYSSGYGLERTYLHFNNCSVSLRELKLYYGGEGRAFTTDLHRRVIKVNLSPKSLGVEGRFDVDRLAHTNNSSKATGLFRTRVVNLKCKGVAALQTKRELVIEWLQLFCDYTSSSFNSEFILFESRVGRPLRHCLSHNLNKAVKKGLQREVTGVLLELTTTWLNTKLSALHPSDVRNSQLSSNSYLKSRAAEEIGANEVVDAILRFISTVIKDNFNDTVRVPDLSEGFDKNILQLVKAGAHFTATGGTVRDLSSIRRKGNARVLTSGSNMYFIGGVTFDRLWLMYYRYHLDVIGISRDGSLTTSLAPISVGLVAHVNISDRKLYMDQFKITELGDVQVYLTGFGPIMNGVVSQVTTWVVAWFKTRLLDLIEKRVLSYGKENLLRTNIDDIFYDEN